MFMCGDTVHDIHLHEVDHSQKVSLNFEIYISEVIFRSTGVPITQQTQSFNIKSNNAHG